MIRIFAALSFVIAGLLASMGGASAQGAAQGFILSSCGSPATTYAAGSYGSVTIDTNGKLCVNATVSASVSGFAPSSNYATVTSGAASASHALPSGSPAVVVAYNTGTTAVSCKLTVGSGTAVANEDVIQPSSWFAFTVGSNTYLNCINQAGDSASNVVVMSGGTGLATGAGGGGGGSGGGGAVYGPTAAGTAAANPPVLMGGTVDGTASGNVDNWKVASGLGYVLATGAAASGSALAGNPVLIAGSDGTDARSLATNSSGQAVVVGTGTFAVQATLQASGSTAIGKVDPNTIATWGLTSSAIPTNMLAVGFYSGGTVAMAHVDGNGALQVAGEVASGSAIGNNPVLIGGSDGTDVRNISTDSSGHPVIVGTGTLAVQATLQASGSTAIGKVDPNTISTWGIATVAAGSAPTNMQVAGGVYNSGGVTPSNGQSVALQTDSAGYLEVNVKAGGGSGGTSSSFGSAFPSTGTAIGLTNGTNMVAWSATSNYGTAPSAIAVPAVNAYVTNSNANGSATSANSSPVVIASDQGAVAIKAASASIASGAIASGAVASGAFASGAVSSGAYASGSLASGAVVDLTNLTGTKAAGTAAADSILDGGVYNSTLPSPTNGQQTAAQYDNQGRAIGAPGSILSHTLVKGTTAAMTGTSSTQLIAAVSSQHIYPTHISCNNSSGTATLVSIQDGSGGTTLMTLIAPAGGGDTESDVDALTWTTAGNGLYAADVTTGASVICNASGHSSAN